MLKDAVDVSRLRRALVIKLRHHGDVLLASPVFTVLKNHAPHIDIDALVYYDTRDMLTGHPAINTVHTIDRAWRRAGLNARMTREWALFQTLRARRYDLIIHLTESPRGAVLAAFLHPHASVARAYPEKRGQLWRASFTHLYPVPAKPRHTVETHLDALRRIGIQPRPDERGLVLHVDAAARAHVHERLQANGVSPKGYIHFHPTSRWAFKSWDADKCATLIDALQLDGERIVMTAAPEIYEQQFVAKIVARVTRPVVNLAGQLSLKQLAAVAHAAKCFIGVDSVPMHIAAAMQTPVVALFGPSGDLEWGPWGVAAHVITSNHSCRPCGQDGCGGSKVSECLHAIDVAPVLTAVRALLAPA